MFCLCSRMKDSITKLDIFKMLKTIKDLFLCLKTYFHDNQSANHLKKAQSTQFTLMWQRKQQILWFKRRKCEYFAWFLRFLHLICLFAVCVMSMCVCVCVPSLSGELEAELLGCDCRGVLVSSTDGESEGLSHTLSCRRRGNEWK